MGLFANVTNDKDDGTTAVREAGGDEKTLVTRDGRTLRGARPVVTEDGGSGWIYDAADPRNR